MNPLTLWIVVFLLGLAFGGLITGAIVAAAKLRHLGKSWVVIIPETVGTEATVLRVKLKDGKFDVPSRNHDAQRDEQDRMLPQGNVAYHARGAITGPLHIMSSYGANLAAPTKLQAAEHIEKLAVADWLKDYQRQPRPEEAKAGGAFAQALAKAWEKAKEHATLFLVWDPLAYFKACGENDMQDFLNGLGGEKDPWYAKAAFYGVVIVGIVVGLLLLVVLFKLIPMLQSAGQGGT